MQSINTWNTLFEGHYGEKDLSIYFEEDIFISILKSREQSTSIVQMYKIFAVNGDIETFAETLPYQCVVYEKHFDVGEKNTYKFFILNTETEIVDSGQLNSHIERKILHLNKTTSSIVSIVKSYNIKLISLKVLPENLKNFFFTDPFVVKILTNIPKTMDFSVISSIDKLLLGKKNGITINASLDSLRSVSITNGTLDERIFAIKLICENYLLSSKKVVVFDGTGVFKTLSYPQQKEEVLSDFDMKISPFGFPANNYDYFKFKMPLGLVPKAAFISLFKFTGVSQKIIDLTFNSSIKNLEELIENIKNLDLSDEVTEFEKWRIISKLIIISKKYNSYFGNTEVSPVFENTYKNIGSSKILKLNLDDAFYIYYIYAVLKKIANDVKDEILVVLPELSALFNNSFIGKEILTTLKENPKISYVISSEYSSDFLEKDISEVRLELIKGNDAVIRYPDKDPLRLLLRPTLTSSNIDIKKDEIV